MDFTVFYCLLVHFTVNAFGHAYYTKIYKNAGNDPSCLLLEDSYLPNYKGLQMGDYKGVRVDTTPAVNLPEGEQGFYPEHTSQITEIFAENKQLLKEKLHSECETIKDDNQSPSFVGRVKKSIGISELGPEIRKIVDSGDPANRIDVVFMGDGYDASEREKFFLDIDRFVHEMFEGVTFRSLLPLFNIWAIYVESKESGIGYDGPKTTPFKLYREKGELRAVFTENAKYAREVCKMTGEYACDFPSLIGNDDYYGGLGGEFVIFTRSHATGKIVLRHEMSHNFLSAGEEYDNGYAYFGVNAARSLDTLKWSHWLSGEKKEERAMYRILSYPWADLHEKPVNYTFVSSLGYKRWHLTVSVTAAERDDVVEFLMDGKSLPWTSTGITDRQFYNWAGNEGFSRGFHSFSVRATTRSSNPKIPTMICSVALHEFGDESEYHVDNNYVSAYPTWNFWRRKSYRPTNAGCIMRNMTHDRFCPVCQEVADRMDFDGTKRVTLKTLQLGQFRPAHQHRTQGEYMEIKWLKDDVEQKDLHNRVEIRAPIGTKWTVKVRFETPEVRNDQYGFLKASQRFEVN